MVRRSTPLSYETAKDIVNDIGDMVEVMRAQRGLKCTISKDVQMHEKLESFLDMLEYRERLDPQFDPGMPPHLLGWTNRKKMKELMKIKRAQGMYDDMEKSAQAAHEESEVSTDASSPSSYLQQQSLVRKDGSARSTERSRKSDDQEKPPEEAPGQDQPENGELPAEAHEQEPDEAAKQPEEAKPKTSRRRSRSRRRGRSEKKAKSLKKKTADDPKHRREIARAKKRCTASPSGFRMRAVAKTPSKPRLMPKVKPRRTRRRQQPRRTDRDLTIHRTDFPDFQLYARFDPVRTPSSPGFTNTPMSDLSAANMEKFEFGRKADIIRAAVHRMAPPAEARVPVSNRVRASVDKRNVRLTTHMNRPNYLVRGRPSLFKRLRTKLQGDVPSAHKSPGFAEHMQQIMPMPAYFKEYMDGNYKIPYEFKQHEMKQIGRWYWYYNWEAREYAWQSTLPVPANHTFIGIPIHFCSSDLNEIRNVLCSNRRLRRLIVNKVDGAVYVIYCKVYPLLGNVLSTWIFMGCHVPWRI